MKKYLLWAGLPLGFVLALTLTSVGTAAAVSALPRYGQITASTASNFIVNFHSTGTPDTNFLCNTTPLSCQNVGTSTPNLEPALLTGMNVHYSDNDQYALVNNEVEPATATSPAQTLFTLYQIVNGAPVQVNSFAVDGSIANGYIASNGQKAAMFTNNGNLLSVNTQTGAILNQMPVPFDSDNVDDLMLSPYGDFLAYFEASQTVTGTPRVQGLIDLETMTVSSITTPLNYWDSLTDANEVFAFSPDEKQFAYLDDKGGTAPSSLYFVNLTKPLPKTLVGTPLTAKTYTIVDFMYADPTHLIFEANRSQPLVWSLYSYNIVTGAVVDVADDVSYNDPLQMTGNYIAFAKLDSEGADPFVYNFVTGVTQPTPTPMPPNGDTFNGVAQVLPVKSGAAILLKPDNYSPYKTYPLLVWLHGGPDRQISLQYHPYASYGDLDWMLERLRQQGMVILELDYPGSYGYGSAYEESLKNNVGVVDVNAVLADMKVAAKNVNVGKVYIMGNSYGGYLALRTFVQQPNLFAGVVSISGVTDWTTLIGNYEQSIFTAQFSGPPSSSSSSVEAAYAQSAIIDRIPNITGNQPILLFHGNADTEVSYSQATILQSFLQQAGKNVRLVTYPGENHVFDNTADISDMCSQVVQFMGYSDTSGCQLPQ